LAVVLIVGTDPALAERRCPKCEGIGEGGGTGDTFPVAVEGGGATKIDGIATSTARSVGVGASS
jgi:hypothetical protein